MMRKSRLEKNIKLESFLLVAGKNRGSQRGKFSKEALRHSRVLVPDGGALIQQQTRWYQPTQKKILLLLDNALRCTKRGRPHRQVH